MGTIIRPGSDTAAPHMSRKHAAQTLQQYNRALAAARVELTRMRRHQQMLEQQFDELGRASEQWLQQARLQNQHHELRAQSYLQRHNASAMQMSALAQRLKQQSNRLRRQRIRVGELESLLEDAIQRLRELDVAHHAQEQSKPPGRSSLLEPWELRFDSIGSLGESADGVSETRASAHQENAGPNTTDLLKQLAGVIDSE